MRLGEQSPKKGSGDRLSHVIPEGKLLDHLVEADR